MCAAHDINMEAKVSAPASVSASAPQRCPPDTRTASPTKSNIYYCRDGRLPPSEVPNGPHKPKKAGSKLCFLLFSYGKTLINKGFSVKI